MENKTLRDLLKNEYKDVKLLYVGEIFGDAGDDPEIHTGMEWADILDYMSTDFADEPVIEHPMVKTSYESGYYMQYMGAEICYYDDYYKSREKVFQEVD